MEAITPTRLLLAVLPTALACTLGVPAARADIYTWTDAAGRVNISNLTPPDSVHVTSVLREVPKPAAIRPEPTVDVTPQADVQALAERVRQLEREIDLARRQPPAPMAYAAAPAQPMIQYPYPVDLAPPPNYGCDPSWIGCGGFVGSPFAYPASVVVLRASGFHRPGAFHGMRRVGMPSMRPPGQPPGRPPGGMHRR